MAAHDRAETGPLHLRHAVRAPASPPATHPAGGDAPAVIGIDPSITATGIAYRDGSTTTCTTRRGDGDRRLLDIEQMILIAIGGPHTGIAGPTPHLAVVEDLPANAKGAGITGMAQGVTRLVLLRTGVPYALIPPATLKKYATGNGGASKADMRMALYQRAGLDIRDDNQVDAWWLRAMGLDHLGHPIVKLPKTHRAALDTVTWPEAT